MNGTTQSIETTTIIPEYVNEPFAVALITTFAAIILQVDIIYFWQKITKVEGFNGGNGSTILQVLLWLDEKRKRFRSWGRGHFTFGKNYESLNFEILIKLIFFF